MKINLAINICLLILLFNNSIAQTKNEFFGVEQGLSQSNARAIVQDKEGFLWIGTWDGLNRYDGYSFKHFRHNPSDENTLSGSNIVNLTVDKFDRIWMAFNDGKINVYDKRKNEFLHFNNYIINVSPYLFLKEDKNGNFWSISDNKIIKFETSNLNLSEKKPHGNIFNTNIILKNSFALYDSNRVYIINETEDIYYFDNDFEIIHVNKISKDNFLFASLTGKLFEFNVNTNKVNFLFDFHKIKNENVIIYSLLKDSNNRLWVGSSVGLYFSDNFINKNEKPHFEKFNFNFENKNNLGNDVFFSLYEDKSGIIWAGHWTGIFKITPKRKYFQSIPINKKYSDVFGFNFTISIYSYNDSIIFLGTTDGFFIHDIYNNKTEKYTSINSQLSNSSVYFIYRDKTDRIWLGTKNGLTLFNYYNKTFKSFYFSHGAEKKDLFNTIYAITEKSNGELILGTVGAIIIFNPELNTYKSYKYNSSILNTEGSSFILSLLIDNNILWAGTNGEGLLKINLDDMSYKRFVVESGNLNSLSHNKVMALFKYKNERIWIATLGGGLNMLDPGKNSFKHFNINNGLSNNSIYGIVEDNNNNLWFSSNNGISKINCETFEIFNYSTEDGLIDIEYNQNAYYKNQKGEIFFGGINGIVFFNPDEIKINEVKPEVAVTDIKLFNKTRNEFLYQNEIVLNYNENFISFELAALIFDNPSKNQFAYKLEGLNQNWIYLSKRRIIDFSGINPGRYVLKVKAANPDGIWGGEKTIAHINIIPPYWETTWFKILIIIISVFILIMIVVFIVRRNYNKKLAVVEKDNLILTERNKTRDKIARDLHDDLASSVGSAGLYLETAMRIYEKEPENVKSYLEKTSSILTEAKQSMSDIVWAVSPKHDTLENLFIRMKIFANEVFEMKNINVDFVTEGDFNIKISEDIRRNFYLIFKESVFNIIKHSSADSSNISLFNNNTVLILEIKDNGCGFLLETKEQKLGGNGLKNIRKRAIEIDAELYINSDIKKGTTVKLIKTLT